MSLARIDALVSSIDGAFSLHKICSNKIFCLSIPFAAEVDEIIAQTGLTKQQVRRWTHTARTRNYLKRIEETGSCYAEDILPPLAVNAIFAHRFHPLNVYHFMLSSTLLRRLRGSASRPTAHVLLSNFRHSFFLESP